MLIPTLTFRGLLNYVPDLLDGATFPEGIQAARVVDAILWDGGDLPHFCESHFYKWEKLQKTLDLEYNPIENYDRQETWNDSGNAGTEGTQTNDLTTTNSAAPFNESTLQAREQNADTGTVTTEGTSEFQNEHEGRVHGNIGVLTTQEMIAAERRVAEFNLYKVIAADFIEEFCLQIF